MHSNVIRPKSKAKYPYPVTPETINEFGDYISRSLKASQSVTLTKGTRAWIRFMLKSSPEKTNFLDSVKDYAIFYFEPSEVIEYSKLGFFYHFLQILRPKIELEYDNTSMQKVIELIESSIDSVLKKQQKVVVFIPKINSFENFNFEYGNLLYRIWCKDKLRILFVISVSGVDVKEFAKGRCGDFAEVLLQNIHEMNPLQTKDIIYSVHHWCEILEINLSPRIIEVITKLSNGSAYKSKILVQKCATLGNLTDKQMVPILESTSRNWNNYHVSADIEFKNGRLFSGTKDISMSFTTSELELLELLFKHTPKMVSRDDISTKMWGDQSYEKYSDWAIDKFISQIRAKLDDLGLFDVIKTKRGSGFYINLPEAHGRS